MLESDSNPPVLHHFHIGDEIGPFIIVNELSQNDFGATFLCQNAVTGKFSIVKTFPPGIENDPGFMQRFQLTREKLINFRHYNILPTKQLEFENGRPYAVLEYLNTKDQVISLQTLFDQKKRFSDSYVVRLAMGLCFALGYAHACRGGIIHCNLKPSNILLSSSGSPLISEFGLLNLLGQQRFSNLIRIVETDPNAPESLKETYRYMSPEQRAGCPITTQSNVYSLGLILFKALTGEEYNRDQPQPFPKKWKHILENCLAPEPEKRYKRINKMAHQIRTTFLGYLFWIKLVLPILTFSTIIAGVLYTIITLSDTRPQLDLPLITNPEKTDQIQNKKTNRVYNENYAPPLKPHEVPTKTVPIEGIPWKINDLDMVFQPFYVDVKYFQTRDKKKVEIKNERHFWILSTEVSQAQFLKIMGYDPSMHRHRNGKISVHNVTYQEAEMFCKLLTEREHKNLKLPKSMCYRLPSSGEWLFASLPKTDSEEMIKEHPNWNTASWNINNSKNRPHASGLKIPTSQLLYDIHGNVQEWVSNEAYDNKNEHIARGCDFSDTDENLLYNPKKSFPINYQSDKIGFRIILSYE